MFATAIPLTGGAVLNINNLTGQLVGVSNACINWGTPGACQTTTGIPDSVSGSDAGVFTPGSTAQDTIQDLPSGVATPLVDFETVQSPLPGGVVNFDLTSIAIPAIPAGNNCTTFALSAICSPGGGSPFLLIQQGPTTVGITFDTNMIAYTGSSSVSTPYIGIFSTQLSGCLVALVAGACPNPSVNSDTIPNLLNFIAGGNAVTATWAAQESPVPTSGTPEPISFVLFGSGLVSLAVIGRKYRRS
jgi:hypothetical protein